MVVCACVCSFSDLSCFFLWCFLGLVGSPSGLASVLVFRVELFALVQLLENFLELVIQKFEVIGVVSSTGLDLLRAQQLAPPIGAAFQLGVLWQGVDPARLGRWRWQCATAVEAMPWGGSIERFMGACEADPQQPRLVAGHGIQQFQATIRDPDVGIQRLRQHRWANGPGGCGSPLPVALLQISSLSLQHTGCTPGIG